MKARNHNSRVTHTDHEMGTKLRPTKVARDRLKSTIHLKTHIQVKRLKVGVKEARRLQEPRGLQMISQMMILVQKDQMLEVMRIDLAEMMNQTRR